MYVRYNHNAYAFYFCCRQMVLLNVITRPYKQCWQSIPNPKRGNPQAEILYAPDFEIRHSLMSNCESCLPDVQQDHLPTTKV